MTAGAAKPNPAVTKLAWARAAVEQYLGSSITSAQPLQGSITNHVFALRYGARRLILKHGPVEDIRREAVVLALLRDSRVPVPAVLPVPGHPNDVILTAAWDGQPAPPGSPAFTEAGRCPRHVHALALPGFGPVVGPSTRPHGRHHSWADLLRPAPR